MSPNLEKKLYKKYPELFKGRNKPITESLMSFGFENDDGWYQLIDQLCADICEHCKKTERTIPEVIQVKEKFGGLRFYIDSADDQIYDLIQEAEEKSNSICELCGKPSVIRRTKSNWLYNRCNECWRIKKLIE